MEKAKILIIEDDRFLIKLYANKLRREGFEIMEAISGEEGLNKALRERPDLVILDLVLSQKNGFEILSEIKMNSQTKNIPVIILTNLGQKPDIEKGLSLGAAAYLIKTDFSINQLPEIVKEHLVKSKRK